MDDEKIPSAIAVAGKLKTAAENAIEFPGYEQLARSGYQAYGRSTGNKNFRGDPMPAFDDLGPRITAAWIDATRQIVDSFTKRIIGDFGCFARAAALGEPTFTLRARDPTAAAGVHFWMLQNPGAPIAKLEEALQKAKRMSDWKEHRPAD